MTTVMSPSEFDHLVQVVRHKALGYRGECWCGWAGVWGHDYDVADAVAADHRKVAAGPARGLDAALGVLLDLQDDLADALMWLAENWSSDLPVPQARPRAEQWGDGAGVPCVDLVVPCATVEELSGLAELLAAPVVTDAEAQESGHRHQRASRSFGRVHIEGYAVEGPP
jgi:hypothetical protein